MEQYVHRRLVHQGEGSMADLYSFQGELVACLFVLSVGQQQEQEARVCLGRDLFHNMEKSEDLGHFPYFPHCSPLHPHAGSVAF